MAARNRCPEVSVTPISLWTCPERSLYDLQMSKHIDFCCLVDTGSAVQTCHIDTPS